MNDDVGAGHPDGAGASSGTHAPDASSATGTDVARAGSSPALDGDAARRSRPKMVKIPDDDVPPPSPSQPPPEPPAPASLRPMRIIQINSQPPPEPPRVSPPPPPTVPRPNSKIPPAPGTQAGAEEGWTPGVPAALPPPRDMLAAISTEVDEEVLQDDEIEAETDAPLPPPRSAPLRTKPDIPVASVRERVAAVPDASPPLPPARPALSSKPPPVEITSAPPPPPPPANSRPPVEGAVAPIAPPPPRPPTFSRPTIQEITGTPPPPPPRPPSVTRPDITSSPPPPPPPRPQARSHPDGKSNPPPAPPRPVSKPPAPPPPPEAEARPPITSDLEVVEAEVTPLPISDERPSAPEIEEIYVSVAETGTEEPPGLAAAGPISAPVSTPQQARPAPPPVSQPRPPESKPAEKPAEKPVEKKAKPPVESKKRVRPWWEEMFDDDFLRSVERLTDKQIVREASFIEDRLGLQRGAVVLDLGCGSGRHAIELTKRGYKVVGYDLSLAMLARAQDEADAANEKVNFLHGDMREMAFEAMFDGVYCWGTSFGFFEEEKNQNVIQRVHKALRPGGVLLLDVINRDFIAPRQPNLVWFEGDGCVCMDETNLDFITSRLKVKRTLMIEDGRTREIDYSIRLYALHELGKILHDCGFKVLEVSGQIATPAVYFGSESPRTIVLAERS